MKFALHFGNITFPNPNEAKQLVLIAEAAGFDSVIAVEHVVIPTNYQTKYPYNDTGRLPGGIDMPWPDPLAWLTYVGAITEKLKLVTGVLILPQRNPLVLAKHIATVDCLTNGRMELGVGVGWLREEFDALNIPFSRRGARVDEYIRVMRALWNDDDVSFQGDFISFEGMSCNPKPKNGRVPIIIGGHSRAAALRAARIGDGFFPATGAQTDMIPAIELVKKEAYLAGRDPSSIEITTGCPDALPSSQEDPLIAIAKCKSAGIHRIALPVTAFLGDIESQLHKFGEQVIKKFN